MKNRMYMFLSIGKKLMCMLFLVGLFGNVAKANPLTDQIQATLIDHVEAMMHFDDNGNERISLLDSVLRIGHYDGQSVLHIQGGFSGDTAPEAGEKANWIAGAMLRIDPFFTALTVPEQYEFLKNLEVGIGYHHDFETKEEFGSLMVGLAFDPTPKE